MPSGWDNRGGGGGGGGGRRRRSRSRSHEGRRRRSRSRSRSRDRRHRSRSREGRRRRSPSRSRSRSLSPESEWEYQFGRKDSDRPITLRGKTAIELVRAARRQGVKGKYGAWPDFLRYVHRFGEGVRPAPSQEPERQSPALVLNFLKTFHPDDRKGDVDEVLKREEAELKAKMEAAYSVQLPHQHGGVPSVPRPAAGPRSAGYKQQQPLQVANPGRNCTLVISTNLRFMSVKRSESG